MISLDQQREEDIYEGRCVCIKDVVFVDQNTEDIYQLPSYKFYGQPFSSKINISELIENSKLKHNKLIDSTFFLYKKRKFYLLGADPMVKKVEIEQQQLMEMQIVLIAYRTKVVKKSTNLFTQQPDSATIINAIKSLGSSSLRLTLESHNSVYSRKSQDYDQLQQSEHINPDTQVMNYYSNQSPQFIGNNYDEQSLVIYNSEPQDNAYCNSQIDEEDHQEAINSHSQQNISGTTKAQQQADIEKRVKERSIFYVVKKVQDWRRFYEHGVENPQFGITKLSLDESANYVRLSRKTLDDYYAQIRRGQQLGFDFEAHKDAKMGTLRKFVRDSLKDDSNKHKNFINQDIHSIYISYRNDSDQVLGQILPPNHSETQPQNQTQPNSTEIFDLPSFNPDDAMEMEFAPPIHQDEEDIYQFLNLNHTQSQYQQQQSYFNDDY